MLRGSKPPDEGPCRSYRALFHENRELVTGRLLLCELRNDGSPTSEPRRNIYEFCCQPVFASCAYSVLASALIGVDDAADECGSGKGGMSTEEDAGIFFLFF